MAGMSSRLLLSELNFSRTQHGLFEGSFTDDNYSPQAAGTHIGPRCWSGEVKRQANVGCQTELKHGQSDPAQSVRNLGLLSFKECFASCHRRSDGPGPRCSEERFSPTGSSGGRGRNRDMRGFGAVNNVVGRMGQGSVIGFSCQSLACGTTST